MKTCDDYKNSVWCRSHIKITILNFIHFQIKTPFRALALEIQSSISSSINPSHQKFSRWRSNRCLRKEEKQTIKCEHLNITTSIGILIRIVQYELLSPFICYLVLAAENSEVIFSDTPPSNDSIVYYTFLRSSLW